MDNPNWLNDLFISQAKPALDRYEGSSDDSGSDVIISSLVDDINGGSDIAGSLTEKLEYLSETKNQLKEVAVNNGVAVDDDTPFRDYPEAFNEALSASGDSEKTEEYERFFRAVAGKSLQDWNPVDGVATITTRGIEYTAANHISGVTTYSVVHIFPESDIYSDMYGGSTYDDDSYCLNKLPSVVNYAGAASNNINDYSRLPEDIFFGLPDFRTESFTPGFLALPPKTNFSKANVIWTNNALTGLFNKGLSFGKSVINMTNNWMYYSHAANSEKPVYVMEGFKGDLYLSKLNIFAEHLIGIINNLGEGSYVLNIGDHNTAKLTDEQIQIATDKGWTVS